MVVVIPSAHFEQRGATLRFDFPNNPSIRESSEHTVDGLERGARKPLSHALEHICRLVVAAALKDGEHRTARCRRAKTGAVQKARGEVVGGRNCGHAPTLPVILNDSK